MRFKGGSKNIRILFRFTSFEKREIALLLCTFEEKDTKDYRKAIEIADRRVYVWEKISCLMMRGI